MLQYSRYVKAYCDRISDTRFGYDVLQEQRTPNDITCSIEVTRGMSSLRTSTHEPISVLKVSEERSPIIGVSRIHEAEITRLYLHERVLSYCLTGTGGVEFPPIRMEKSCAPESHPVPIF